MQASFKPCRTLKFMLCRGISLCSQWHGHTRYVGGSSLFPRQLTCWKCWTFFTPLITLPSALKSSSLYPLHATAGLLISPLCVYVCVSHCLLLFLLLSGDGLWHPMMKAAKTTLPRSLFPRRRGIFSHRESFVWLHYTLQLPHDLFRVTSCP